MDSECVNKKISNCNAEGTPSTPKEDMETLPESDLQEYMEGLNFNAEEAESETKLDEQAQQNDAVRVQQNMDYLNFNDENSASKNKPDDEEQQTDPISVTDLSQFKFVVNLDSSDSSIDDFDAAEEELRTDYVQKVKAVTTELMEIDSSPQVIDNSAGNTNTTAEARAEPNMERRLSFRLNPEAPEFVPSCQISHTDPAFYYVVYFPIPKY